MGDVIERHGKTGTRYYVRFVDTDGKRRMRAAKGAKNRKAALAALHDEETHAREGKKVVEKKIGEEERLRRTVTLRELAKRFCEEARPLMRRNYRATERVIRNYRQGCRSLLKQHILDRIGDVPAASLDTLRIERLREQILEGFAENTCGKALGTLSRLFEWARRERLLECPNPVRGVSRPHFAAGSADYLSQEDAGKLIAYVAAEGSLMLHAMVMVGLTAGLRKGEMLGLRRTRLHLDAGRIDVENSYDGPTKGGLPRSLKLHPTALPVLRAWLAQCPAPQLDLVFPVLSRATTYRMGKESDMLGLPEALTATVGRSYKKPWHLLRHTFASHLAMSGVSLFAIQKLLGHANPAQTMVYAKLSPDHLGAEVSRLSYPAPPAPAGVTPIEAARSKRDEDRSSDTAVTNSAEHLENKGVRQ